MAGRRWLGSWARKRARHDWSIARVWMLSRSRQVDESGGLTRATQNTTRPSCMAPMMRPDLAASASRVKLDLGFDGSRARSNANEAMQQGPMMASMRTACEERVVNMITGRLAPPGILVPQPHHTQSRLNHVNGRFGPRPGFVARGDARGHGPRYCYACGGHTPSPCVCGSRGHLSRISSVRNRLPYDVKFGRDSGEWVQFHHLLLPPRR